MKILLVRSRYIVPEIYFPRAINEPLGLEYLASAVTKSPQTHQVKIFDSIAEGWNKYTSVDNKNDLLYQGASLKTLQKTINRFQPDVIGISWLFSVQNRPVIETINFIKQNNKNIPLIVGGPHPSANPTETMKQTPNVDIVVYGEGEVTLKELLDNELSNLESINGIVYKKNNEIIQNPPREFVKNMDDISLPARNMVPYSVYSKQFLYVFLINLLRRRGVKSKNQRTPAFLLSSIPFLPKLYYRLYNKRHKDKPQLPSGDIISSRGCPNNCVFCAVHAVWKHTWRSHSLERVLEDIDNLVSKHGVKRINIQDDNFNLSKDRIIKICKAVVERKYNITFDSPSGVYVPTLDNEVLGWMKVAGFRNIRFSIESGNQEVLKNIVRKRIDLSKVPGIVKSAQKVGLNVEGAFILGLPGETVRTMNDSVEFAKQAGFDTVKHFVYQPFPDTDAYKICKDKGYLTEEYDQQQLFVTGNKCFVQTEDFTPSDVLEIARRFN